MDLGHVDKHVANIKTSTVSSSPIPFDRIDLVFALSENNRFIEFYGTDKNLLSVGSVEDITYFPPTLIVHGAADAAVSVEDSKIFINKVGQVFSIESSDIINLIVGMEKITALRLRYLKKIRSG